MFEVFVMDDQGTYTVRLNRQGQSEQFEAVGDTLSEALRDLSEQMYTEGL